ncbi:trace amine-associated receptor 13c-like [Gouania willdenowi]|uniref:trace amine-associated receptor 13c-like n=1 Tax=Gouania willdenowi TaxID=441366 RepID=UPI0010546F5A|nr:trace amine-associated receptor 13c-like [Gouania willdenowi]
MEGQLCFPQLLNTSCTKPATPQAKDVLLQVVLSLVSVLTTALNLLVIISISHFKQLHSPTNLLLLSLAVSDFLVGLLLMPAEITSTQSCWFLGDVMCVLYYINEFVITSSSVGNMVLISIDRYLAVCEPLHYHSRVTLGRTVMCICLCWLCSFIYNTTLILNDFFGESKLHKACWGECVVVLSYMTLTVDFVINFIGPICVIIVLYMRVFVVAVSQARAMHSHITAATHQPSRALMVNKSEMKAAKILGVVVVVFIICICPYYAPSLSGEDVEESTSSSPFNVWLVYLNSCLNPIIYAMFYPWFRKSVKLIVTLKMLQPNSRHAKLL